MRDDLISRKAAIDAISREIEIPGRVNGKTLLGFYVKMVKKRLERLPSAEQERKTGRWVATPNGFHYCSNCRMGADYDNYGHEVLRDFCPNCGSYNGGNNNGNE